MRITSPAFDEGATIPKEHTCEGKDISPGLEWTDVPEGTRSFALICDDPDAPMGTWVHWVIYNIPADADGLPEGVPGSKTVESGAAQGVNDFKNRGYGGPCPPAGGPHRYYFKLYALDVDLRLEPGATKDRLLEAMAGHILEEAQLMGKYARGE